MPQNLSLSRLTLVCCIIPVVAALVAVRQGYLNRTAHLSTWKGGGMGMFAGADSDLRFTRTYIEKPDGVREPIIGLLPNQAKALRLAIWYPTAANFAPLARSLRSTSFVAAHDPSPIYRYNSDGERVEKLNKMHYLLHAKGSRSGPEPEWTLAIEYWEMTYDVATRSATAALVETHRFPAAGAGP